MLLNLPENCPICGRKMEKGNVTCPASAINWSSERKSWTQSDTEILARGRFKLGFANAEAYRCPNCKIVLFSYEKEKGEKQT